MAKATKVKIPPRMTLKTTADIRAALAAKLDVSQVEALFSEKLKKHEVKIIQDAAADALKALAGSVSDVLKEGFDAENPNPSVEFRTPGGAESMTINQMGARWAPLSESTLKRKQNRAFRRGWKRGKERYRYRLWADRTREGHRIVTALRKAFGDFGRATPTLVKLTAKSFDVSPGRDLKMKIQYALTFNKLASGTRGADALAKAMLRSFIAERHIPLNAGDEPSGSWTGRSPAVPEHILYPEAMRPLLGPMAAVSGRRFRAELRRLLK